jgi:hypothetical protein
MQKRLSTPLDRGAQAVHFGQIHSQPNDHGDVRTILAAPRSAPAPIRNYTLRSHLLSSRAIGYFRRAVRITSSRLDEAPAAVTLPLR